MFSFRKGNTEICSLINLKIPIEPFLLTLPQEFYDIFRYFRQRNLRCLCLRRRFDALRRFGGGAPAFDPPYNSFSSRVQHGTQQCQVTRGHSFQPPLTPVLWDYVFGRRATRLGTHRPDELLPTALHQASEATTATLRAENHSPLEWSR